ncbi:hypothetical protein DBR11_04475 [Pedobacter sp. HMWF019]|uniref:hypothetical protein n=1 Tax=Pedobacter sp. HMWF019 TaxID=2056856 RepID=UPI000D386A2C|nr:hypothetical protein [Pedobacter sp. HMWF019]PTT02548.1 hypothetical protein DBR11_04475 [Pedobacter sp. HMWF019]
MMKIKCLYNTGEILMNSQRKPKYVSENTKYSQLKIGEEYLVLGILMIDGLLYYLVDDGGIISECPSLLFCIIDNKLPDDWFFSNIENEYTEIEAVWGYYELVFDPQHYSKLINMDEEAHRIYYRKKMGME